MFFEGPKKIVVTRRQIRATGKGLQNVVVEVGYTGSSELDGVMSFIVVQEHDRFS